MKKIIAVIMALCVATLLISCRANDDQVIRIGAIFPLSGPVAFYGTESRDGGILAVEEINAAGGLLGKQLVLLIEDDEGRPELTINAFTRLTSRERVGFIFGSSTSGATMAISNLAQSAGVLLISPSATNPQVTLAGNFVFRACFIDPFQGVVGADFAFADMNLRRAAILFDAGADYNTGLADAFRTRFTELGGIIVADEAYQTGDVDFNAQVTRIRATNPDVVYLPNYYNDVALQAIQLRDQGVNAVLLGGDGWDGLIDNAGDEVIGGLWSSAFASDTTEPRGRAFVEAFQRRFNRQASQFAALGYDAIMMLADAIRTADSSDAAAVRDALARTNGYYVTGHIRFDANRNPIKSAAILEIARRDGRLANVYRTTVNPRY